MGGNVNKLNCCIWKEHNLHPERGIVFCATVELQNMKCLSCRNATTDVKKIKGNGFD